MGESQHQPPGKCPEPTLPPPKPEDAGRSVRSPAPQEQADEALRPKYEGLRRTDDGSEVEGWYFVLRESDPHTPVALTAYADACEQDNPTLAADLRRLVYEWKLMAGLYDAQWER